MTQIRHSIRNIDPEMIMEARLFSVRNKQPLGEIITEALEYYLEDVIGDDGGQAGHTEMLHQNLEV